MRNIHATASYQASDVTPEFGKKHVARGLSRAMDAIIKSGSGSYLEMEDGRKMLDFICGIAVTNLGHCHPKVSEAAAKQAMTLVHGQCSVAFSKPYLELVNRLLPIMPHPSLDTFFFWNSGAEAVEASIKLARVATRRQNVIAMAGGYHGRTFGTMGLTRSKTIYSEGMGPLMPGVYVTPFPYWHQLGLPSTTSEEELVRHCMHQLNNLLAQQTSPGDTAAILVEPLIGEGGYVAAPPAFLHALREVCDKHGILLICDEVQCGFGRTGKMFFSEYSGVRPDIMVMAKGLANGFPLSAIVSRKEIMDKQKPGTMGGTYAGNPVSCAAAVAVTEAFAEENILENVNARSRQLFDSLHELQKDSEVGKYLLDVRGAGLMVGVEFASPTVSNYDTAKRSDAPEKLASRVVAKCMENGLMLLTTSIFDVIRFMPPLNVSEADMAKGCEIFKKAVKDVTQAYIPAQGTNSTAGVPTIDDADSTILLRWADESQYQEAVSKQLSVNGSLGISKGALVHFWENATIPASAEYTTTPWIAMIDCDRNSSDASVDDDIFTLARDRGAVAALLYSTLSETCYINPEYLDPDEFDKVLDIYTTVTKSSANLIESQFDENTNTKLYYFFNGTRLNQSATAIENAIEGEGVQPGYLIATLKWDNTTDPDPGVGTSGANPGTSNSNNGGGGGDPDTGLAMIILYVITGCVSLLFCIVIISGMARAFRHPERYGPRRGDPTMRGPEGAPQTRAAGLTRAILDTFPVVKFGRGNIAATAVASTPQGEQNAYDKPYNDPEWADPRDHQPQGSNSQSIELKMQAVSPPPPGLGYTGAPEMTSPRSSSSQRRSGRSHRRRPSQRSGHTSEGDHVVRTEPTPEMIGTETCPICILDFEDGDDVRVLPCEGHHKFHKDCVDQWLLELSTSCPLCREDFQALENMANGVSPEESATSAEGPPSSAHSPQLGARSQRGFTKYLRTAQRRRHSAIGEAYEEQQPI
ncbi:hypothetical protein FRB97_009492 [Tulasnella sp. 331]|nr:hypothetical protein FRB97_009492 [Tulasnella sp. 331]